MNRTTHPTHTQQITMKPILPLIALLGAALASSPAWSLSFEGAISQGATVVTPYVDTGLISFDIDFANTTSVSLDFRIDEDDLLQPLALNAVLRNFTGLGLNSYTLSLDKGAFGTIGSVTRQFGGTTQVTLSGNQLALLNFNTPEYLDIELGNALGTTPGAFNWTLTGLQAGDRVNLTVSVGAVPEPEAIALMLAGLGVLGASRLRGAKRSPQA